MVREILSAEVASHVDMQVVGQCANVDLRTEIPRVMANVVILRRDASTDEGWHQQLLTAHGDLKVVVVVDEGRGASFHQLLDDPSPVTLVRAVRRALLGLGMKAH